MTIPTIAAIRDQIVTDIQTGLGAPAPLPQKSVWRVLATAMAAVMYLVYRFNEWVGNQIFTETADEDALVLRATEYGLTRTPAQAWRGTATVTGVDGTQIPAGTLWQANGQTFDTEALVVLGGGGAIITLEALLPGEAGNMTVADELRIVSPIAGLDAVATVATVLLTGEDPESIESLRRRLLVRQANQPQGGAIPDWILWATEVPGIAEAFIDRPTAGFVYIYPLTDDPDPLNRIPGSTKLDEVKAYATDDRRSPIRAANVEVLAANELEFDVDISDLTPNNAQLRLDIENAIADYMFDRRPRQYSDEVNPRDTVSAAQITRFAVDAGAEEATVVLKTAGGTPITRYVLDPGELAILRDVTWI